ncbi:MAG: RraA family protein [Spirochaetia bacterium]|nr:RraA family protein [Spirochaetia bacterium]
MTIETLLKLQRWNTPAVYNGWEAVTDHPRTSCFNLDPVSQFTPKQGIMAGRAVTVVIEPGNPEHPKQNMDAWNEYRAYIASIEGPKIVVVQDLDSPKALGAFWGEVNTNIHLALGCVGTITDGAVRDIDEIRETGFNVLARRLCVGHAWSYPVRWNCSVSAFGCPIEPGQLLHADQHGFLAIPKEDEEALLHAAEFLDSLENETVIAAAKQSRGKSMEAILASIARADNEFGKFYKQKLGTDSANVK